MIPKGTAVMTRKGLSGFSRGSPIMNISFKAAIPMKGPEFDFVAESASDNDHRVQYPYGGKTIISEGQFMDGSFDSSLDQAVEGGFNFTGTFNPPK